LTTTRVDTANVVPDGRGVKRKVGNAASLFANDAVQRAITFVIYMLISRYLGAEEFGQLSLTLAIFYLLQSLAPAGLKILVMREVARDRSATNQYFINGSLVAMVTSILALGILLIFLSLAGYSQDTVNIVLLISVGLIPFSMAAISEAIFQAWEQIRFITVANVPLNIARGLIAFWLLSRNGDLISIGYLFLATYVVTLLVEWSLYFLFIARPELKIDLRFSFDLLRSSATFLALQSVIAVLGSFLLIVLSKIASETDAGFYNAASQIMSPIILFCQSIAMSLFPAMCRRYDAGLSPFRNFSEQLAEILNIFTIPAAVGLFVLAEPILILLYGNKEFLAATTVLQISAGILIFKGITSVLGRMLIASKNENTLFKILIIELIIHVILGIAMTLWLGLIGAAIATLLTAVLEVILHIVPVWRALKGFHLEASLWKPLIASLGMAAFITFVRGAGAGIVVILLSAVMIYAMIWLALSIWTAGGFQQLKSNYLRQWSE
jgi:O-antigen/teichoic acid export membrane protein